MLQNMRKLWFSLSGRLLIFLVISLVGLIFTAVQAFWGSFLNASEQVHEEFSVAGTKMKQELSGVFEDCETAARLIGYSTSVQRYLLSDDASLVIQSYSPAVSHLNTVLELSSSCENVLLYSYQNRMLSANSTYRNEFRKLLKARGFDEGLTVTRTFFARIPGAEDSSYVFYCFPIYSVSPPNRQSRILAAVLCNMDNLTHRVTETIDEDSPDAAVLMFSGSVASATRELSSEEQDILLTIPKEGDTTALQKEGYWVTAISMPERGWDFVYFIPENELLFRALRLMNPWNFLLLAAELVIAVFLMWQMRAVNRNIRSITEDMDELDVEKPKHIREPKLEELQVISRAVNHMLDRLHASFLQKQQAQDLLYEAIHAQGQAEMMAYRNQINPHFLFNTLECIRSMAHSRGVKDIETLISSMALMFRYSLYSGALVPFSQEITHVQNYFDVVRIRFSGKYTLLTRMNDDALGHMTLSMILQPIVENCVNHAFLERDEDCRVLLTAHLNSKGGLVVRVIDNGSGMDEEQLEKLERRMRYGEGEPKEGRSSIGLHNIFKRMKLTFGNHFHIRFRSRKGAYTVVELIIPESTSLPPFEI